MRIEFFVAVMMVEGEFDEARQRRDGCQTFDVEFGLAFPHLTVRVFQRAQVKPLLVAEVIVDHALAETRTRQISSMGHRTIR